jgi:hypothetical protein
MRTKRYFELKLANVEQMLDDDEVRFLFGLQLQLQLGASS